MDQREKQAKWMSYKKKMLEQYGRKIKGKFESEQAYIKRYSNPLEFLKYKLGRSRNLNLNDLKPSALEYYKEIGGLDDVDELIKRQTNIDSLGKAAKVLPKKRRFIEIESPASETIDFSFQSEHHDLNNHNVTQSMQIHSMPPPLSQAMSSQSVQLKKESNQKIDVALEQLNGGLNVFEKELLEKKKSEAYQVSLQKINAIHDHLIETYRSNPELIGCVIGAGNMEDQLACAFDVWLKKHRPQIKNKVKNFEMFIDQVVLAKQDHQEWLSFVSRWKIERILKGDEFTSVWRYVRLYLNVEQIIDNTETENDKNENDSEDESSL